MIKPKIPPKTKEASSPLARKIVANHDNGRNGTYPQRQTKQKRSKGIRRKTIFPHAPSPALLRIPLPLGGFLYKFDGQ